MKQRRLNTSFAGRHRRLIGLVILLLALAGVYWWQRYGSEVEFTAVQPQNILKKEAPKGGKIISIESVETVPAEQVLALSRQNYGAAAPQPTGPVTKALVRYQSYTPKNEEIVVYARIYLPTSGSNLPVFAFAPGTTGIGDQCAASLEQPAKSNWANYESHMMAYAGQGYASVITDYEGMRDPSRIHHYMIGELEGRAVLDSIRAMGNWENAKSRINKDATFVSGFSQGGHSAMWADKIAGTYAPEMNIKGVIGFGPVNDVKRTLADVTRGANINWFGPFVMTSYQDYYKRNYDVSTMLQPRWVNTLSNDVSTHCIDSVINYWGRSAAAVYTPAFRQAMSSGNWNQFADFSQALDENEVGDQDTASAKLINQGQRDNVILHGQQEYVLPKICRNSQGAVGYKLYPSADHYNIMVQSFGDTIVWMKAVTAGQPTTSACAGR